MVTSVEPNPQGVSGPPGEGEFGYGMNTREREFKELVESTGFRVRRNGWPDFAIVDERGNIFSTVELKCGFDKISREQELMHEALQAADVPVVIVHESDIPYYIDGLRRIRGYRDAWLAKQLKQDVTPLMSAMPNAGERSDSLPLALRPYAMDFTPVVG